MRPKTRNYMALKPGTEELVNNLRSIEKHSFFMDGKYYYFIILKCSNVSTTKEAIKAFFGTDGYMFVGNLKLTPAGWRTVDLETGYKEQENEGSAYATGVSQLNIYCFDKKTKRDSMFESLNIIILSKNNNKDRIYDDLWDDKVYYDDFDLDARREKELENAKNATNKKWLKWIAVAIGVYFIYNLMIKK